MKNQGTIRVGLQTKLVVMVVGFSFFFAALVGGVTLYMSIQNSRAKIMESNATLANLVGHEIYSFMGNSQRLTETLAASPTVSSMNADQIKALLMKAKEKNINFLFEASCGGGIPIIRALNGSLTADEVDEITGILNGTTNYMMYKMATEGSDFDVVLKEAQQKGYAEADPTADVEGYDACRKIAILSSLAYGKFLNYENVYTEGITKITPEDMEYAREMGRSIKLLGTSKKLGDDSFYALVAPFLVGQENPLYGVKGVFNSIFVHGNMLGDAMFYGSGAGKLPTASAVVADVVEAAKHLHDTIPNNWSNEEMTLMEPDSVEGRFFVRVKDTSLDEEIGRASCRERVSSPV